MIKTFSWSGTILAIVVISSLSFVQSAQADEPCGNIIENNIWTQHEGLWGTITLGFRRGR